METKNSINKTNGEQDAIDRQYIQKLISMHNSYQLEKYSHISLKDSHSPFEGTPKKHPNDDNIIILLLNPFSKRKKFYEFPINSIGGIEDLGTISSENGETAYITKIWVKKGMPGLMAESFIVE